MVVCSETLFRLTMSKLLLVKNIPFLSSIATLYVDRSLLNSFCIFHFIEREEFPALQVSILRKLDGYLWK